MTHLVSLRLGVGHRSGGTHLIATTLSSYLNHCNTQSRRGTPAGRNRSHERHQEEKEKDKRGGKEPIMQGILGDFWVTYPASLSPRESPGVLLSAGHFLKPLRPLRAKEFSFPHARLVSETQMWPVVRFSCTNITCDLTTLFSAF